jgi:hypothetical protein
MSDPIEVVPVMESWQINIEEYSVSGTRTYIEDLDGDDPLREELPRIGSSWDTTDYSNLLLVGMVITYVADYYEDDDNRCARKFVCNYSGSTNLQQADALSQEDLPISMSVGAQITSFEPKPADGVWKWLSDDEPVDQVIGHREAITNITAERVLASTTLNEYHRMCSDKAGKLNSTGFKIGSEGTFTYGRGSVIFDGADFTEYRNSHGAKRYKVSLKFTLRRVTFDDSEPADEFDSKDGWCYLIRDDTGEWDIPYTQVGASKLPIYKFTSFSELFTMAPLGDDELSIVPMPLR